MKASAIPSFIIPLLFACSILSAQNKSPGHEFIIDGTARGLENEMIVLNYVTGKNWVEDSTRINGGKFKFNGNLSSPVEASLFFKNNKNSRLNFYLENNSIEIQLNSDSIQLSSVSGSLSNIDFDSVQALLTPYYVALGSLRVPYQYAADRHLDGLKGKISDVYDQFPVSQRKLITEYAFAHPGSYAITGYIFMNFSNNQSGLSSLEKLYNNFTPSVKNSDGGKSVADLITRMKRIQIGNLAPDFTLPDQQGEDVKFSSFKGKYVLLDFWASWCVPCREESPFLVKAFDRYKDKNYTIVGISFDIKKDKQKWIDAIKEDGLLWTQLSSLKGYEEEGVRQLYSVQGIPDNFLISPEGKIISRGLRGDALNKKLAELFDR